MEKPEGIRRDPNDANFRVMLALLLLANACLLARVWILCEAEGRLHAVAPITITLRLDPESEVKFERGSDDKTPDDFAARVVRDAIAIKKRLAEGK